MRTFRLAVKADEPKIMEILHETDLYYPKITLDNFWVAEENHEIAGIVQFREYDDYFFLSSFGVRPSFQKKGIAKYMIENLFINSNNKNIYIYTTLPEFFAKFGFKKAAISNNLPSRESYQCRDCFPENCFCMIKEFK